MDNIGIFFLNAVLFPETALPLHIFEPRYKNLINDSFNTDTEFGITFSKSDKIHKYGCSAKVTKILTKYPDGKLDIVIKGIKRYYLLDYKLGNNLYFIGDVQFIDSQMDYPDVNLLIECVDIYNKIAEKVKSIKIEKININSLFTLSPSFTLAQKSGLTLDQKYQLLELDNENERLSFLIKHLSYIEPLMDTEAYSDLIIKNDGYLKVN